MGEQEVQTAREVRLLGPPLGTKVLCKTADLQLRAARNTRPAQSPAKTLGLQAVYLYDAGGGQVGVLGAALFEAG
jgi:hypothetical protein